MEDQSSKNAENASTKYYTRSIFLKVLKKSPTNRWGWLKDPKKGRKQSREISEEGSEKHG